MRLRAGTLRDLPNLRPCHCKTSAFEKPARKGSSRKLPIPPSIYLRVMIVGIFVQFIPLTSGGHSDSKSVCGRKVPLLESIAGAPFSGNDAASR